VNLQVALMEPLLADKTVDRQIRWGENLDMATITVLLAALSMLGNAAAQKDSVPKPQDKLALGENDVKHLLLLMEADRHGKVSRQEYMKFMAAEFDRLDKAKSSELDDQQSVGSPQHDGLLCTPLLRSWPIQCPADRVGIGRERVL